MFDDITKGIIIRRKSKDRQYNSQTKKGKWTNNDLQNITQKTKYRATWKSRKNGQTKITYKFLFCVHFWKLIKFPSFPVVDWFCLFISFDFPLEDFSEFGNFLITLNYDAYILETALIQGFRIVKLTLQCYKEEESLKNTKDINRSRK